MNTAQDQQSRELLPCPFCGKGAHFEHDADGWQWVACESCGMESNRRASLMDNCKPLLAEAWNRRAPAVQAARALPHGIEPVAWLEKASVGYSFWVNDAAVEVINGQAKIHLFTAAQVQAMGRVPPEWQAVPMESTRTMKAAGRQALKGAADCTSTGQAVIVFEAMCAAAPRPPAAQEGA